MKTASVALALAGAAAAARPNGTSICDYYTGALLKENNATNQETLLTLVVNTAVIGNYTTPNHNSVPGLLAPGTGNYSGVNLLPFFTGALLSTNTGGSSGASINFLDGGAATPLEHNMAANSTTSNQYRLLTHLYEYFATLLGCSEYGTSVDPYAGRTSMYEVHKYMGLDEKDIGWFIENVGLSAASFGVTTDDVDAVGKALNDAFGYKCAPAISIPKSAEPALQAICIAEDCPTSVNATCSSYAAVVQPSAANSTSSSTSSPSSTTSSSPSSTASSYHGSAAATVPVVSSIIMSAFGLIAFML